jgi:hypothetical protein
MIYVSCIVPENRVWDVLNVLEAAKVGNVQVRHVIPVVEERAALKTNGGIDGRGRPPVTTMVRAHLKVGKEYTVVRVAKELSVKKTSVHTAFGKMIRAGEMERAGFGIYRRISRGDHQDVETV